MKANGSCLCKSVKFSFELKEKTFDSCHCSMCRTWGGGPALTVASKGSIIFEGEKNLKIFSSSDWAERGFCGECGTNIFYRLKDPSHSFCNFNLGTIDNHKEFEFTSQIYIDSKPDNYSFSNKTKNLTEKEVIEAFGFSE